MTKVAYASRVFRVEEETVTLPNGRTATLAIVRHRPSVVLIPLKEDGRVVMIRQYRHPLAREIWELPAGSVDDGETPEAAARRECEEEIGEVPAHVDRIGAFYPTPGYCDEQMIFFRVQGLRPPAAGAPRAGDEDEDIAVEAMPLADARAMVARGAIVDLKTAYALTLL